MGVRLLMSRLVPVGILLALVGAPAAFAAPGELDPSFAAGKGFLVPDLGAQEAGNALAIQPDGKILVAGNASSPTDPADVLVARFLAQGSLDTSFGPGTGFAKPTIASSQYAYGMALQPDGKIVLAGFSQVPSARSKFLAVRLLNPEGTLDTSFGQGGTAEADFGSPQYGYAVGLQGDGKIVVAGTFVDASGDGSMALMRFLSPAGTVDPSFDGAIVFPEFPDNASGQAMALQRDGKIVAVGGSGGNFGVARANADGTPDAGFGGGTGIASVDFGHDDSAGAVALQADGKIVVAGYTSSGSGASETDDIAVARLLPNGSPDNSFGTNGRMTVDVAQYDFGSAVAVQADGKIVVAGDSGSTAADDPAVVRLQPGGTVDSTFGHGGKMTIKLGVNGLATSVGLQGDGKIVVAGNASGSGATGQNIFVARLQNDVGGRPTSSPPGSGGGGAVPRCGHKKATIIGTSRRDKLTGTKHSDVIVGLGGNDTIKGGGGNDIICAGSGNDKVSGGSGNDKLSGESGKDSLSGGDGSDALSGGSSNDKLSGGNGRDRLTGDTGSDVLSGGAGSDKLLGGPGNDKLKGGAGKDRLSGGPGKDRDRQ